MDRVCRERRVLLEGLESRMLLSAPSAIGGDSVVLTVTSGAGWNRLGGIDRNVGGSLIRR